MTGIEDLDELVEMERQVESDPLRVERGWERLRGAVAAGALPPPDLAVPGPLQLGTVGSVAKLISACAVGGAIAVGAGVWVWHGQPQAGGDRTGGTAQVTLEPSPPGVQAEPSDSEPPGHALADPEEVAGPQSGALQDRAGSRRVPGGAVSGGASFSALTPPAAGARESPGLDGTAAGEATFDAELALIKRAKTELDSGSAAAALELLSEHARRFPKGVFAGEREALRVLALCASGRSAQGRALAAQFVSARPRSPLVDRVRRACGLPPPDSEP